jgi:histidinol dehydrogenase
MNYIKVPQKSDWKNFIKRQVIEQNEMEQLVKNCFETIQKTGDQAIKHFTYLFDNISLETFKVSPKEIETACESIDVALRDAIQLAAQNIEKFHASQIETINKIETTEGVTCWRESRGIENVGIYIPGGSAPLFSTVLMLGIPAKLAGCKNIALCSPPNKNGQIHPAILYTANLIGIKNMYKIGGIQAIGGLTFGTTTIPKVDKIFGPGNQYVTAAKQLAQQYGVAIDMPAGPSELLIIADNTANPEYVAADLLSQAEHGQDSQVILLSESKDVIKNTLEALKIQLDVLPRKAIASKAINNSQFILLNNLEDCFEFSNLYAPEHLILALDNSENYISKIEQAGSVFLGHYSCESVGDYASGTNHTLPTNGYAKNYSGVSLDSFVKKITFQKISKAGLKNIGPAIEIMAEAEELIAHKNAVTIRLKDIK